MKRIFISTILSIAALFIFGGGNASGQTVSGSIGNGTVAKGKIARGKIVLSIPGGVHVNSNRPNSEYSIPTVLHLSGTGVKISGISYPRGQNRKFGFSENYINVYEGQTSIPFNVTVPANFKGKTVRIKATIRYQACTEDVCYPPRNKELTLIARVR